MKTKFHFALFQLLLFNLSAFFCSAQWTTTYLSQPLTQLGGVAYGNKAYFAGGNSTSAISGNVEIYDVATGNWNIEALSVPRAFPAAVASDGKVFFAGGVDLNSLVHYDAVDIFDTLTHQWSTASLSAPRMYIQAAAVGSKVLFAGGYDVLGVSPLSFNFTNVVDVYDILSGTWTTQTLSEARAGMAVAVAGNLAIFAGGQTDVTTVSNRVDIYNATTDTWSIDSISEARTFCTATTNGGKVLIAGGVNNSNSASDRVDIYDATTGEWTTSSLLEGRCFTTMSATACGKSYFIGGGTIDLNCFCFNSASNTIDIYDSATNGWSNDALSISVFNHVVVGTKNKILVGGGSDLYNAFNSVEVFTCEEAGITGPGMDGAMLQIFPNPASENSTLMIQANAEELFQVKIFDLAGKLMSNFKVRGGIPNTINISDWSCSTYIVKITGEKIAAISRLIKD